MLAAEHTVLTTALTARDAGAGLGLQTQDAPAAPADDLADALARHLAGTTSSVPAPCSPDGTAGVGADGAARVPITLSGERASVVRRLVSSGGGVEVVVGKAGTGKTTTLAAATHAWHAAGLPVLSTAVAARAALGLGTATGTPGLTTRG